jgi:hypothetical protein
MHTKKMLKRFIILKWKGVQQFSLYKVMFEAVVVCQGGGLDPLCNDGLRICVARELNQR